MTEGLKLTVDRRSGLAVLYTDGYINNQGGEEIARAAYELIDQGYTRLLLNLHGTKIINSIGISILLGVIDNAQMAGAKVVFSDLKPESAELFDMLDLTKHVTIQ